MPPINSQFKTKRASQGLRLRPQTAANTWLPLSHWFRAASCRRWPSRRVSPPPFMPRATRYYSPSRRGGFSTLHRGHRMPGGPRHQGASTTPTGHQCRTALVHKGEVETAGRGKHGRQCEPGCGGSTGAEEHSKRPSGGHTYHPCQTCLPRTPGVSARLVRRVYAVAGTHTGSCLRSTPAVGVRYARRVTPPPN